VKDASHHFHRCGHQKNLAQWPYQRDYLHPQGNEICTSSFETFPNVGGSSTSETQKKK